MQSDVKLSVYSAMLSQIAKAFQSQIQPETHQKDMLEYTDSFTGKQGIVRVFDQDVISSIIKIKDRNVAIVLGRALDSQGFFHDVTWTNRLRDSPNELYKFGEIQEFPNGVFTLLADCYSPTCSRNRVCYSITCPRRFEQQNQQVTAVAAAKEKPADLWSASVPPEILESISKKELTRQEVIFEIIQTEKEFVRDLENTIKYYVEPLKELDIIPISKRQQFIKDVFSNISELHSINSKLLKKLIARQKEAYVVEKIGDIFANITHEAYPYIEYGAQQVFAKNILDEEKLVNPELAKFLKETEKLPEFRKLPIESFLARPTTRMGRYPLLLKPVMEKAADNHPDRTFIPQALADFKTILSNINIEAGRAENIVRLGKLQKQIIGFDDETEVLRLNEDGRQIIRDGKLVIKKPSESEVYVFLFDHMLLVARKKDNNYKIARKPVPLELLLLQSDKSAPAPVSDGASKQYTINIHVPPRYGGPFVLHAATQADKTSWIEAIEKQQLALIEKKKKFEIFTLVSTGFPKSNQINCSCTYLNQLIIGTDNGLYIGSSTRGSVTDLSSHKFTKVLDLEKIVQVDVLPKIDILLVLADKTLLSFPLRTVMDKSTEKLRPKKISSTVTFFRQGICNNMTLVCTVKSTALTATVKVMEPVGLGISNLNGKIGKMFKTSNESLRLKKEFYIPSESKSIHFLNTKLCIGCTKGFELVELESLQTQGLLDPSDESLDFVLKRETVRPIAIFKMKDGSFLLCYNEFGFFIDKLGRRSRPDWLVYWSGNPNFFSYSYPYVIAFEPTFIEIRNIETGQLQQIIHTQNLKVLSSDPTVMDCVMDSDGDSLHVFRLALQSDFIQ